MAYFNFSLLYTVNFFLRAPPPQIYAFLTILHPRKKVCTRVGRLEAPRYATAEKINPRELCVEQSYNYLIRD